MYVHRGKNRRNKRGNETVHFFGPRKDDSNNRLKDEVEYSIVDYVSSFYHKSFILIQLYNFRPFDVLRKRVI